MPLHFQKRPKIIEARQAKETEKIETEEGTMTAQPGDLVVTGTKDEEYPVKPDIFYSLYEAPDGQDLDVNCEAANALDRLRNGLAWAAGRAADELGVSPKSGDPWELNAGEEHTDLARKHYGKLIESDPENFGF